MFENLTDRLSQTLRHVTGKAKLTEDRVGYMLHKDWVCDLRKAPPISIWQAVWDGEAGMKMTAEWYKDQGWL